MLSPSLLRSLPYGTYLGNNTTKQILIIVFPRLQVLFSNNVIIYSYAPEIFLQLYVFGSRLFPFILFIYILLLVILDLVFYPNMAMLWGVILKQQQQNLNFP